jgi:hypothetical protein
MPVVLPSAEVISLPIMAVAWVNADACRMLSSFWLIWTDCSTCENAASWATYSVDSMGLVGSWFFISATSSRRNAW